jgi:DHA3 family macrolide efflux protein-like MFS transporter
MNAPAASRRFPRSSPYWPVINHPQLRRVLPGLAVSALGDGMALVAVSWLALHLAPLSQRGTWIAVAVAAYTLPSAAGTILFGRLLRGRSGAQLAGWDATLRAVALAAIPIAAAFDLLTIGSYVVLLAASSLLHSWGSAGRYTLIAELLPRQHHLPANAVLGIIGEFATIAGPPLAGLLIAWGSALWVIGIDAVTFAVLGITYRLALPTAARTRPGQVQRSQPGGFTTIRRNPALLGLLTLTFAFFFLFGPVYVALPLHVADDLHGSATLLGGYYTAFGIGALAGGLAAGHLRRSPLWPTTIGIVVAFGAAMLPLGLGVPAVVSLVGFAVAGLFWAPYMSTSMALFQGSTTVAELPAVLAANGAVTVMAVPLGTMLGGPIVTAVGPRTTLLLCATTTIAVGLTAAGIFLGRRGRPAADGGRPPRVLDRDGSDTGAGERHVRDPAGR